MSRVGLSVGLLVLLAFVVLPMSGSTQTRFVPPDTLRSVMTFHHEHPLTEPDVVRSHPVTAPFHAAHIHRHHPLTRTAAPPETVVIVRHTTTTVMTTPRPVPWLRAIAPQSFKQLLTAVLILLFFPVFVAAFRRNATIYGIIFLALIVFLLLYATR